MIDVLGIHGIGQQQRGREQMLPDWRAALGDGVERSHGRTWPKPTIDLAYYGDVFLGPAGGKGAPVEIPDGDVEAFLMRIQQEVVTGGQDIDNAGISKGFKSLPTPLTALAASLERRFGMAGKLLFFGDLIQVRRFQRDDDLAGAVLDRVRELLGEGQRPRVLIGHSLGSIVAYEALCRIPGHSVRTLITLGSPLGLRSIRAAMSQTARERTPGLPPQVERWINIYDPHDPVSLAGGLAGHWPDVEDSTVDNENDAHNVLRYLGKKVTGHSVVDALA